MLMPPYSVSVPALPRYIVMVGNPEAFAFADTARKYHVLSELVEPAVHIEVVAGPLLLLCTYLVFPYFEEVRLARLIFGGFLLGLALCLRVQLAPVSAVLGLALIIVNGWRRVLYTTLGAVVGLALAGLVDYQTLAYQIGRAHV